jgi:hypothetical protein
MEAPPAKIRTSIDIARVSAIVNSETSELRRKKAGSSRPLRSHFMRF